MTSTTPDGFENEDGATYVVPLWARTEEVQSDSGPIDQEREEVLTQTGLKTLANFIVAADTTTPVGGVRLVCECGWWLPWGAHVLAPDLRHLAVTADQHWRREHL